MGRDRLPSVLLACLLLAGGASARAEQTDAGPELPGELRNKTFDALEKEASELVGKGDWSAAIEKYQALIDEVGDRLVPPRLNAPVLIHVRRLCHLRIAALPAEALRLYRNRVDARARQWLDQGTARRDPAPLLRLLDEAFCSRPGEEALDLLGDLAFERGRFDDAERWWRLLLKDDKQAEFVLTYPDPQTDLARVRAKVLLAQLFRGEREGLKVFRTLHPDAEGVLAGRKGKYADTLDALANDLGALRVEEADAWPTLGGAPSRSLVLPRDPRDPNRLTRLCQLPPWRFDLEKRVRIKDEGLTAKPFLRPALTRVAARSLAFSPVIAGKQVLVADARHVTAFDLTSGEVATWFDLRDKSATPEVDLKLPAKADLRYTLTVTDDAVFARLGAQVLQDVPRDGRGRTDSFLVCLRLQAVAKGDRLRWLVSPEPDGAVFEGAPVVAGGRAFIAATRFAGEQAITAIHCYPAETDGTPAPRWRQEVSIRSRVKQPRYAHHLLTLAGPNVIFCSHSGAIIALDAATGRHVWAVRYTSRGDTLPGGEPSPRDLTPCVVAAGRLFATPADGDRLLCLDPATGQLLWQREKVEVVHLLGVGQGRLIFTTPEGIRGVRVSDGGDVPGWQHPGDGSRLATFGRGLLAGDLVYWPTAEGLFVLNQKDGAPPDNLVPLSPEKARLLAGNLAMGDGCVAVADTRELRIFTPPARQLREREQETKQRPESASTRLRLALAEADAGLRERAQASFDTAERQADATLFGQSEPLRRQARQGRHELLLEMARQARVEGRGQTSAELEREAGRPEFLTRELLRSTGPKERPVHDHETGPRLSLAEAPPAPSLPLFRSWEIGLASAERLLIPGSQRLLPAEKQPLFFAAGRRLTCRAVATGQVCWTVELPFAPTWIRHALGDRDCPLVLTAGPGGAACLLAVDGRRCWEFTAPSLADGLAPLAAFHLDGGQLFFGVGRRWLFVLDASSGQVLWSRDVPAKGLRREGQPPPVCTAGGKWVVSQSGGGTAFLDARTGSVAHRVPPRSDPLLMPRPPLFLTEGDVCLPVDSRHIARIDPATARTVWTHEIPGATTRTGETPWLLGDGKAVLLLVARNYGYALQRLDPEKGKRLWTDECLLSHEPIDPATIALDEGAFYFVAGRVLVAHSLNDGRRLWERPLTGPVGRWQVVRAGNSLLAYPVDGLSQSLQFRWLSVSLQWEVARPPEDRPHGFPVLICDPKTGQPVQRLNLSPVGGRLSLGRGPRPGIAKPAVLLTGQSVVVALEGRAWGLREPERAAKE